MPVTDRERDEIRMQAQNFVMQSREEWEEFKMQGREYLQEPEIDFEMLEELMKDAQLRTPENSQRTEGPIADATPAPYQRPEQVSGLA